MAVFRPSRAPCSDKVGQCCARRGEPTLLLPKSFKNCVYKRLSRGFGRLYLKGGKGLEQGYGFRSSRRPSRARGRLQELFGLRPKTPDLRFAQIISKGADNWNMAMGRAAEGGHLELVGPLISKGADNWNRAMDSAAKGGHRDLVDLFISKGANNRNGGMAYAAKGGHRELVDLFISEGANSWNWGMAYAAKGGHRELVDVFKSCSA